MKYFQTTPVIGLGRESTAAFFGHDAPAMFSGVPAFLDLDPLGRGGRSSDWCGERRRSLVMGREGYSGEKWERTAQPQERGCAKRHKEIFSSGIH